MEGGGLDNQNVRTRTVKDVFINFRGRRAGIIKALTTDVKHFSEQCCLAGKESLCLFGYPNESWQVKPPGEYVPAHIPEPTEGINHMLRNRWPKKEWLKIVATHSDAWLVSVAFYYAYRIGFTQYERKKLFEMINKLPDVTQVVTGFVRKRVIKPKSTKNKEVEKEVTEGLEMRERKAAKSKKTTTLCGLCEKKYRKGQFWIRCDVCMKWFHGKCVDTTFSRATKSVGFECPACKKARVL